jgi:hypothetical protein
MFDDMKGANRSASAPDDSAGKFTLRKFFRLSWILVVIVALVIAGIFYARWQESRDIAEKAAEQQRKNARAVVEGLGGSSFQIMSFYASPGVIHRGDSAELCYGVANAASVAIDPKPSEGIWPSVGRCISISPKKTTTYTLTAVDAKGQKKTQSLTLEVQ